MRRQQDGKDLIKLTLIDDEEGLTDQEKGEKFARDMGFRLSKFSTQNKTKTDDKDERKIYVTYKYSQGIPLSEAILVNNQPFFLQLDQRQSHKPIILKRVELPDIIIEPPERTEYISEAYNFKSSDEIKSYIERAKKENIDSLFTKIKSLWKLFIYANDDFYNICVADTIFTCFQDKFGMCHYLLIIGDNNTGKSNVLTMFKLLAYRPISEVSLTAANIYNFYGSLEEGQGTILEEEINDIDDEPLKKKIYQVGYISGQKVTRIYDSNISNGNVKRKKSRQQGFFTYGPKFCTAEKMPDEKKSKGILERIIPLHTVPGNPTFDISEVINPAGDKQLEQLKEQFEDLRKLLLIFRMLHYYDSFPDLNLNIKNRYKQLTKPLIRLFQDTESLAEIIKSLSNIIKEKNQKKIYSLDSALLTLAIELVAEGNKTVDNEKIWQRIKQIFKGQDTDRPDSCYTDEFGYISKKQVTSIYDTKFGAKRYRNRNERGLIFDMTQLRRLVENYKKIDEIEIISKHKPRDKCDSCDTFTESIDKENENGINETGNVEIDMTHHQDGLDTRFVNNCEKKENKTLENTARFSEKVSHVSHMSQGHKCVNCDKVFPTKEEKICHSLNRHPGKLADPDAELLKLVKEEQ